MVEEVNDKLLHKVLDVMRTDFSLKISNVEWSDHDSSKYDVTVEMEQLKKKLHIEIKRWANHTNTAALIHQRKASKNPEAFVLLTEYVNPVMAERLKEANVQFIDTVGNAFIRQASLFIFVKGNKDTVNKHTRSNVLTGKSFTSKGLQVVYTFLQNKEALTLPYRDIAKAAHVSLGTVGEVIKDLEAGQYLVIGEHGKTKKPINFEQLSKLWVLNYANKINKNHHAQFFTTDDHFWFNDFNFEAFNAVLSGEAAASKYTNYLNSTSSSVYIDKQYVNDFMRKLRLRKVRAGEHPNVTIELLEPFVDVQNLRGPIKSLAHPLIVYAELIASNDVRNMEVAEKIYEKYISIDS